MNAAESVRRRYLRRRPWFQYRLRTLALLTALVAAALSCWKMYLDPAGRQVGAIDWLKQVDARIVFAPDSPDSFVCGRNWLEDVVAVELDGSRFCDDDLRHFGALPRLRRLSLALTDTSDAGLAHLGKLEQLERLSLVGTKISDDGIAHLAGLDRLRELVLTQTELTSDCLEHLEKLYRLRRLKFAFSQDDEAIRRLAGLPELKLDGLHCVGVTDEGLRRLKRIQGLGWLVIEAAPPSRGQLTDAGLAHLAEIPSLRLLHVQADALTGDALAHLARCPALRYACLDAPQIPQAAAARHFGRWIERVAFCNELASYRAGDCRVDIFAPTSSADVAALAQMPHLRSVLIARDSIRNPWVADAMEFWLARSPDDYPASFARPLVNFMSRQGGALEKRLALCADWRLDLSPRAIQSLEYLHQIERLTIANVRLTDGQLAFVEGLWSLEYLDIDAAELSGWGLAYLKGLDQLRTLHLSGRTRLGYEALLQVVELKQLETLYLGDTPVSVEALQGRRSRKPSVQVALPEISLSTLVEGP